jgi:hypothetical protein
MNRWLLLLAALAACALARGSGSAVSAAAQEISGQELAKQEPSFWMKKKLDFSQNILAGIATADFEKVEQNARAMRSLNQIEKFVRGRGTNGYRTQLQVFEFANDELVRFAGEKNVDGAGLAFTQLTLSCVNCHKQMRRD